MMQVPYDQRWIWLKEVLRQPASILTDGTKVTLVAIWEAMDSKTGITTRHYATIAAAVGMSADGVRRCVNRACRAGYLLKEGKGGISAAGGNACRFQPALPGSVDPAIDERSRVGGPGGPGRWTQEAGSVDPGVRVGGPDNTPLSSPSIFPERESPLIEAVAPALPRADFHMISLWEERWPDDETQIPRHFPIERCPTMIGVCGAELLGYTLERMPKRDGEYIDRTIVSDMDPQVMGILADLMYRGKLRAVDLAHAVASMGYAPAGTTQLDEEEEAL